MLKVQNFCTERRSFYDSLRKGDVAIKFLQFAGLLFVSPILWGGLMPPPPSRIFRHVKSGAAAGDVMRLNCNEYDRNDVL
jgi:hypothetical protein